MEAADADRLWYFCVAIVGFFFYRFDAHPVVVRSPSWTPIWLLKGARDTSAAARLTLLLVGLALACFPTLAHAAPARATFFAAVAVADLWLFVSFYCHPGFVLLHMSAAMILPAGPERVAVLRLIVAHQLGSSGVMKLRIAGVRGFCHPDAMERWLRFTLGDVEYYHDPHVLVQPPGSLQPWLVRFLLAQPALRTAMSAAGLAFEMSVLPIVLFGSGWLLWLLFAAASCFHLMTLPIMGIFFPLSIQCYALALLPAQDEPNFLAPAPLVAALLLGASTFFGMEDWPLNAMSMFPYSWEQSDRLGGLMGRFKLAFKGQDESAKLGPCITTVCCSACAAAYWPHFIGAVGGTPWRFSVFELGEAEPEPDEVILKRLKRWVRQGAAFVDPVTWTSFDDVRLVETPKKAA